jgi:rhomboid protease GluP
MEPVRPQDLLYQFRDQLAGTAPTPWLTWGIIGINIAIYFAMLLSGIHFLDPAVPSLLRWGANLGSWTTSGQWWRLFTCTFLHIGLVHILFNMFVLWDIGRFMERLIGPAGFAVVYVLAGLSGSIASMGWNPYIVSAGASGAIFGLYGCLLGYLLAGSQDIPAEVARKLRTNALVFLAFNLVWGLTHRDTDMAGHLGGLLAGLACGFALVQRLHAADPGARNRVGVQLLFSGLAILALAAVSLPKSADLDQELARFRATESSVGRTYNQALERAKTGSLTDPDFARILDLEVIAPWHSARMRLEGIHGLPEAQTRLLIRIERYAETRERAWGAFSQALRQKDPNGMQRSAALHAEAEAQLKAF